MRIDSVSGIPSEVERPVTTGAVTAAATEVNVHSNETEPAPVLAVAEVQKPSQAVPSRHGETVWLDEEKRQVFRIVDPQTGDVVCQVPSDEVLRVSRNLVDLVDDKQQKLDVKS